MPSPLLIAPTWLQQQLGTPDLQVIDASWHLPAHGRDARADHARSRIQGAIHLDIDTVAARVPGPPGRMFPPPDVFAAEVGRLGIRPDAHLVVYDTIGMYSAARVWWLFRSYGHGRVSVLDGGLPAWQRAGGALQSGPVATRALDHLARSARRERRRAKLAAGARQHSQPVCATDRCAAGGKLQRQPTITRHTGWTYSRKP